jgi:hypothetical protein
VESIKPEAIERGMVLVDEVNESAYTVLDVQLTLTGSYYVKGLALTNWGSLIQKNFTYLTEDGELFVVARPAPFALPLLPARGDLEPSDADTHSFPGDALVIDGGEDDGREWTE